MSKTVVGLFDDVTHAQAAVQDLISGGVPREQISLTTNDARGEYQHLGKGHHRDHGHGAAAGAGIGAVLGGLGGVLVELGLLAVPGIGPILALGPIATALVGAGVGAAAGGLLGALTDLGIHKEHAHAYAEGVRRGGSLVTVTTKDDLVPSVVWVLERHGAVDIDRRSAEWREKGWAGFNPNDRHLTPDEIQAERGAGRSQPQEQVRVPVTQEELHVDKQPVQRGTVRVYNRVEERPVEQAVQLREEHVSVARRPADRLVTERDRQPFTEETFEIREVAEVPVVTKQRHVTEEVVIQKDVSQRTETIRDTVRNTNVEVEQAPGRGRAVTRDRDLDE